MIMKRWSIYFDSEFVNVLRAKFCVPFSDRELIKKKRQKKTDITINN